MHIIASRTGLLSACTTCSAAVPVRSDKAVLKCLRLTTLPGQVLVAATDLDVGIRHKVRQVEIKKKGDLLIPADKLTAILRSLEDETIAIEGAADLVCHLRGSRSHFEVNSQDPKDFPPVADAEGEPDFDLPAGDLATLISRTLFAVSDSNTRYAIAGQLWRRSGQALEVVATDGRVMALATARVADGGPKEAIVSARWATLAGRLLGGLGGDEKDPPRAAVQLTDRRSVLVVGDVVLSGSMVEGRFPEFRDVIPQGHPIAFHVAADLLCTSLRQAALLTTGESRSVRLKLSAGELLISGRAPGQGESAIGVPIEYAGDPLEIGFNSGCLMEALSAVRGREVEIRLRDSDRPMLVTSGREWTFVGMPIQLN